MKKARALLGPLSLLVAIAFGCTVIAEVDRDKIPDDGQRRRARHERRERRERRSPVRVGEGAASEGGSGGDGRRGRSRSRAEVTAASPATGGSVGAGRVRSRAITAACGSNRALLRSRHHTDLRRRRRGEVHGVRTKVRRRNRRRLRRSRVHVWRRPRVQRQHSALYRAQGCAACEEDDDCGGGETQCVDGVCEACDTADNAGCTDSTKPICNSSHVCEKCSGNCPGDLVGDISGACTGCDAHTPTARPPSSTPICDETSTRRHVFQCRACINDADCVSGARPRAVLHRPMRRLRSARPRGV